jgi:hypothetical protein
MTTAGSTQTTTVVPIIENLFTPDELTALAGFLAGYSGLTRDAYALDLRMYTTWCQQHGLHLFQARRPDIECFGRDLEAKGRARATIARRLCTISGFYRYAVEEELLEHSPAVHVRRPRLDYESHAIGLDRNEVGALLVAAALGAPNEHALISLLAINGEGSPKPSAPTSTSSDSSADTARSRSCARAARSSPSRSHPALPVQSTSPSANDLMDPSSYGPSGRGWTGTAPAGSCVESPAAREWTSRSGHTPCATPSSPPH